MSSKLGCFVSMLVLLAFGSITSASTITWTNTAGGNWNVAANWSPNQVPGSNDTANVTTAGTYAITLNVNANVNDLTIGGATSGVQSLEGNSFKLVATNATVSSGGILNLTNSTLSGSIVVDSGAVLTVDGVTVGGQVTVESGGELLLVGLSSTIGAADANYTNEWLWVQSGGLLNSASSAGMTLESAVTNSGVINLTNSTLTIYNYPAAHYDGVLVNQAGGTINLWAAAGIQGTSYNGGVLINQGGINLGSGSSTIDVASLTSPGTVATLSGAGTLLIEQFNGLGSLAGSFNAAAGTIIQIGASASPGTSADPGLVLGGAGQYQFVSGLLTLTNNTIPGLVMKGGTLALGANFQGGAITDLTLDGASLSNTLPVTGTFVMTNGTLDGSIVVDSGAVLTVDGVTVGGQVTVESGGELLLVGLSSTIGAADANYTNEWLWVQSGGLLNSASSAGMTLESAVTNSGVINLTNSTLTIYNYPAAHYDGVLVNQAGGTINLWAAAGIQGTSYNGGVLINQGGINLGSGSSTIDVASLTSPGTVATLSGAGTLLIEQFNGLGSLAGSFNAAAGTIIQIGASASPGTSADPGLVLGGAGQYQFVSGLLTLTNNTIPGLVMKGGTLALGANFQGGAITDLTLDGASLSNTLPVTGTFVMTNGTLDGSIVVDSGAVLTVDGVTVGGQVTVESGGELLLVGLSSTIGAADANYTNEWLWVQSGGLLNSASSAGMTLESAVTNSGVINLTNSTLTIYNYPAAHYDGVLVNQAGGTINLWAAAGIQGTSYNGGVLINQGGISVFSTNSTSTIDVTDITNSGTLSAQHGTLQLQGNNLNLQSSETFSVGLNSAADYGRIEYDSSTALNLSQAGTFQVTLNGGYVPAVSNSFTVLLANGSGTFSGAFTNFSSPSGAIWKTNYTATSLILTNVGQITWSVPSTITYGMALGGGQLDASTTPSVAGAFVYNPGAGTVLDSGASQLLTATFNPSVAGDAPASLQVQITVMQAPLAVTATNQIKTYGQNFTFVGTEFVPTGLVNGDFVTIATIASAGAISNAPVSGSPYAITITNALGDAGLTNYIITYTNGLLTVNPAPLGITANSEIKTYGQNVSFAGTEFTSSGLQNLETIGTVTLASTGAISNAPVSGSPYSIMPSAATGGTFTPGNYAVTYTNGTLTVNRAGLTVTANNAARNYGVANPAFSASYGGFVNNETATVVSGMPGFSTPATMASAVGSYTITPLLGTLSAANYSFGPFNPGTLTINPAALSITASNQSKTYGQTVTFAGTEFATSGLVNGDSVTSASLASTGAISNAPASGSPYAINITNALGDAGLTNYTISYFNGALMVNKATLTITADSTNKIVGETWTFAGTEFTASGLQNAETVGTVTLTSAGAPALAVAGPYNIVPSAPTGGSFSQANYTNNYMNGTLTVYGQPELFLTTLGNQYVLTFQTVSGQMYQLQSNTNLVVAGWSSLGGPITGNGSTISVTNTIADQLSFFKLQITP